MKLITSLLLSLVVFLSSVSSVQAIFIQSGDNLNFPEDRTFNESVIISGSKINISSIINGDLYCAGEDITISGVINGNVYCAGQSIKSTGLINGGLHLAGQNLDVAAIVNKNALLVGQTINLSPDAGLKTDALIAGQTINLNGPVSRDLLLATQTLNLNSTVGRHSILALQNIIFGSDALINGNLDYYYDSASAPSIDSTKIKGSINSHPIANSTSASSRQAEQAGRNFIAFSKIASLLSTLIIGLTLIYFNRHRTSEVLVKLSSSPLVSFFIGFAVLFLTPLFFIVLLLTLIGLPLAFILLLVYIIGLISAPTYTAIYLGRFLFSYLNPNRAKSLYFSLFLGSLVLWLLMSLPGLGFFIGFISLCLGLGAFFTSFLPQKESLTTA